MGFRLSSQAEDLKSEFRILREKLDNVACTEDLGSVSHALSGVAQALSGSASASDVNDIRSGFVAMQGEFKSMRSDLNSLVKSLQADRAGVGGASTSPERRGERAAAGSDASGSRLDLLQPL